MVGVQVRVDELPETMVTGLAEKARVGAGQALFGGVEALQVPAQLYVPELV